MDASASRDSLVLRALKSDGDVPLDLIPATAGETHEGIHLTPNAVVWDAARHRALVFYNKSVGEWGRQRRLGASLAVWPDLDVHPERPSMRPGNDDPTLMFDADEPDWGSGAVLVGDWLYVYGEQEGNRYRLARVPVAQAIDRSAWRFYASGSWVVDSHRGWTVLEGQGPVSVAWNAHLGKYLAVNTSPISNQINVRTAARPEGPWSDPVLVDGLPSTGLFPWINSAVAHPELGRDNGRFELLTYNRGFRNGRSETRVLEVEFRKR